MEAEVRDALTRAACNGDLATIKAFLSKKGARVNRIERISKTTLLICAAWNGYNPIVKALLKKDADPNFGPDERLSALAYAVLNGKKSIVK